MSNRADVPRILCSRDSISTKRHVNVMEIYVIPRVFFLRCFVMVPASQQQSCKMATGGDECFSGLLASSPNLEPSVSVPYVGTK